jgi:hypothetical protein
MKKQKRIGEFWHRVQKHVERGQHMDVYRLLLLGNVDVAPQPEQAFRSLKRALDRRDPSAIVEVVYLYMLGYGPGRYRPDPVLARQWLEYIWDTRELSFLRSRINMIELDIADMVDLDRPLPRWLPPQKPQQRPLQGSGLHGSRLQSSSRGLQSLQSLPSLPSLPSLQSHLPQARGQRATEWRPETDPTIDWDIQALFSQVETHVNASRPRSMQEEQARRGYTAPRVAVTDSQNVHDSGVTQSIRNVVRAWGEKYPSVIPSKALSEIQDELKKATIVDKKDAQRVLDTIASSSTPLSSVGQTEATILALAWEHSKSLPEAESKQARENLFQKFTECFEHGMMVCTTGRMTRLVSAFEGIDESVSLQNSNMMQQLLLGQIGRKVQDKLQQKKDQGQEEEFTPEEKQQLFTECVELAKTEYSAFPRLADKVPEWVDAAL